NRSFRLAAGADQTFGIVENSATDGVVLMDMKLSQLTLAGWLLTLVTIGIVVVLIVVTGFVWNSIFPAVGCPELLLGAPGIIIGVAFYSLSARVLKKMGLPVVKRSSELD